MAERTLVRGEHSRTTDVIYMRTNGLWWWIDRWRKSTAFADMTLEEQGAYRNILDAAALRGGLLPALYRDDERVLAKACGDPLRWPDVRAAILPHLTWTDTGWRQDTLDEILKESQRRAAAQQRYRLKLNNPSHNGRRHTLDNTPNNAPHNKSRPPGLSSTYPPISPLAGGTPRLTKRDLKKAAEMRERVHGGCPHSPRCSAYDACVHLLAQEAQRPKATAS